MSPKILGKYLIEGNITALTGLHIGGSTVGLEIGGLDNPVIKDPLTDTPIIPGSSLKGKLRSLTEWRLGLIEKHPKHEGYQAYACEILKKDRPAPNNPDSEKWEHALILARLYGPATDEKKVRALAGPTRLTVRDAFLTNAAIDNIQKLLGKGTFTEVKTENSLDRVTSEANPRPIERVPAGSVFHFSLIVDRYEQDDIDLLRHLFTAMSMLEHSSLGGGGSRGSGQVKFKNIQITWRSVQDYVTGNPGKEIHQGETVDEILKNFSAIQWPT